MSQKSKDMADVRYGVRKQGRLFLRQPRSANVVKCKPSSSGYGSQKQQQGDLKATLHCWPGESQYDPKARIRYSLKCRGEESRLGVFSGVARPVDVMWEASASAR